MKAILGYFKVLTIVSGAFLLMLAGATQAFSVISAETTSYNPGTPQTYTCKYNDNPILKVSDNSSASHEIPVGQLTQADVTGHEATNMTKAVDICAAFKQNTLFMVCDLAANAEGTAWDGITGSGCATSASASASSGGSSGGSEAKTLTGTLTFSGSCSFASTATSGVVTLAGVGTVTAAVNDMYEAAISLDVDCSQSARTITIAPSPGGTGDGTTSTTRADLPASLAVIGSSATCSSTSTGSLSHSLTASASTSSIAKKLCFKLTSALKAGFYQKNVTATISSSGS